MNNLRFLVTKLVLPVMSQVVENCNTVIKYHVICVSYVYTLTLFVAQHSNIICQSTYITVAAETYWYRLQIRLISVHLKQTNKQI